MSTPPRASFARRRRALVLGTASVSGLLLVWAAAAPRPPRVLPGLPDPDTELVTAPPDDRLGRPGLELGGRNGAADGAWVDERLATVLGWGLVVVAAAAAVLLAVLVGRALWRAWHRRRRPPAEDARAADVVPARVLADQSERMDALGTGTPREGIIAAWARLEASIAIAGVPLTTSRTSTEVVLATLRSHDVPPDTLEELAALFREARYSPHVLTESDRQRAETAHRRVDAELERGLGLAATPGALDG